MEIKNNNDKLALINLAEYVVNELKKTKTNKEIITILKAQFNFSDELLDQII